MAIHKEGTRILTVIFIILSAVCCCVWLCFGNIALYIIATLAMLFFLFTLCFFRSPNRPLKYRSEDILSPADGTVVAIEEVDETEYLKTRCIQISVFMSIWNVHINWHPVKGTVSYFHYHPGKYLVAWHPKSSSLNERTSIAVTRDDGITILFRQIAGLVARRVVCYTVEGASVEQGQQVGFIKFGSRVDIFVPVNSAVKVKLNQKVVGNQTVLAHLPSAGS